MLKLRDKKLNIWDFPGSPVIKILSSMQRIQVPLGTSAFTVFDCFSDTTNLLEDERSLEENQDSQPSASHVNETILDLMAQ